MNLPEVFLSPDWRVYLIADAAVLPRETLLKRVELALAAGVGALQLRAKDLPVREALELGFELRALARARGIPFLVDDRLDLALALGADGLHVGQEDLPAALVRGLFKGILGVSAASPEEARAALAAGADYLGVGAVFPSSSKPDAEVIGLEGLRAVVAATPLPCVAIGGISAGGIRAIKQAGAWGAAVIAAVLNVPDPGPATRELLLAWGGNE